MTLREYFTKHPRFRSDGSVETKGELLIFCGVPFNRELWQQLKENRLDETVPPEVIADIQAALS